MEYLSIAKEASVNIHETNVKENVKLKEKKKKADKSKRNIDGVFPEDVLRMLDQHIVGQEEVKRNISVAVCDHLRRVHLKGDLGKNIPKNNVFIIGPSGSGKTQTCRVLAKHLSLPFVDYDATNLSNVGYQGNSVDDIFELLINKTEGDVELAEKAIIFIDELDKKAGSFSAQTSISTVDVQNSLLKVIEGTEVVVKYKNQKVKIRTHNIMFIAGGAFNDANFWTTSQRGGVGLNSTTKKVENQVLRSDLPKMLNDYGLNNQLVGRFSTIVRTKKLTSDQIKDYFLNCDDSIFNKGKHRFLTYGIPSLNYSDCFLEEMVRIASESSTGVRGVDSVVSNILSGVLMDIRGDVTKIKLMKDGYKKNNSRKLINYTV